MIYIITIRKLQFSFLFGHYPLSSTYKFELNYYTHFTTTFFKKKKEEK